MEKQIFPEIKKPEALEIAIHCLGVQAEQEVCEECQVYGESGIICKEVAIVAISALKEIQQYRKIGTVEECRTLASIVNKVERNELAKIIDEWLEYSKIGTVEECRKALEKQKPKKCVEDSCPDHTHYKCPSCGKIQKTKYGDSTFGCILNHCSNCGQALMNENLEENI